jgi:hypothetical protein
MYPTSELHAINQDIETKNCMMRVVWHGVLPTQLGPPPLQENTIFRIQCVKNL